MCLKLLIVSFQLFVLSHQFLELTLEPFDFFLMLPFRFFELLVCIFELLLQLALSLLSLLDQDRIILTQLDLLVEFVLPVYVRPLRFQRLRVPVRADNAAFGEGALPRHLLDHIPILSHRTLSFL